MTGLKLYDCVQYADAETVVDGAWVPVRIGLASIEYDADYHPSATVPVYPRDADGAPQMVKYLRRRPDELRFPAKPSDIPLVVPGRLTAKVFAAARKGGAS